MAFTRKKEYTTKLSFDFPGSLYTRITKKVGKLRSDRVFFEEETQKERSRRQLDPRVVNLTYLLKNNVIIKPESVQSMFNISDIADLEKHNDQQNLSVLKFIRDNKEKLMSHES